RRKHGAVANEGPPAHAVVADRNQPVAHARRAQGNTVRDEAFFADRKEIRRDKRGRGDFSAASQFGAEELVPWGQIYGSVERTEHIQAQVHGLVEEPFAKIVKAVQS